MTGIPGAGSRRLEVLLSGCKSRDKCHCAEGDLHRNIAFHRDVTEHTKAFTVAFLPLDESEYITGVTIRLDGGREAI